METLGAQGIPHASPSVRAQERLRALPPTLVVTVDRGEDDAAIDVSVRAAANLR